MTAIESLKAAYKEQNRLLEKLTQLEEERKVLQGMEQRSKDESRRLSTLDNVIVACIYGIQGIKKLCKEREASVLAEIKGDVL